MPFAFVCGFRVGIFSRGWANVLNSGILLLADLKLARELGRPPCGLFLCVLVCGGLKTMGTPPFSQRSPSNIHDIHAGAITKTKLRVTGLKHRMLQLRLSEHGVNTHSSFSNCLIEVCVRCFSVGYFVQGLLQPAGNTPVSMKHLDEGPDGMTP